MTFPDPPLTRESGFFLQAIVQIMKKIRKELRPNDGFELFLVLLILGCVGSVLYFLV